MKSLIFGQIQIIQIKLSSSSELKAWHIGANGFVE